ncbi:plastocyanin/azurin family copper-binding protein [Conexibacter sp. CPCC 206217]|uniref:cupredoxin domain-containing protein n=1 Tax=Conexibacter sp. CPCC 206217 TaxID=3064574 RepID=UPI002718515C|nr:plastocyanin/azurin family copper-binding protein [Conexibacter sp. CPCC 206217]MDO8211334.1 plastocyanin/azurin family copper-binding protein [Conexibacter sp. CPCC 206217]
MTTVHRSARRRRLALLTGALASALLLTPVAANAATKTVTLKNIAFNPARVTIKKGDRVTWVWRDADVRHNVTSSKFKSSSTRSSGTYSVTFGKTGTFAYRCTLHPGMTGSVVVRR